MCYLLDEINDEKCFSFHLKSPFRFQDIWDFVKTFWSCRKNGLIRSIRLTSKFMTWQPGLQTIVIRIFPNILQSKDNQTTKFGHLIEYNKGNIFLQKLCRKWGRETSSTTLFIFLESLKWGESKWSAAYFRYISTALNLPYNKNKMYKTLD